MLLQLLSHQWKEATRSSVWQKNLAINLVLGFVMLIFVLYIVLIGFFLDKALEQVWPNKDPLDLVNGALLFYFLIDLGMRFFMQELPVLGIQPYLHLPVAKGKLVHFVLWKSITSLFNLLPLLLFVPFAFKVLHGTVGAAGTWAWIAGLFFISLINNFLIMYFKRQLVEKPMVTIVGLLVVIALAVADYVGWITLSTGSRAFFGALASQPALVLLPIVVLGAIYFLNYKFLIDHTYPEEMRVRKQSKVGENAELGFLQRFGEIGTLIGLELKLILRNKRSRSIALMSCIFLVYGLVFYPQKTYSEGYVMLIFVGIFITGASLISYGQFVPAWQSAHFDALLTKRLNPYTFYLAKFWLFVPVCVVAYLISLLYGFMPDIGGKIIIINTACLLYNIGVNTVVMLYMSTYNKKRIDLSKSASFNYQGVGVTQFLMGIPCLAFPMLICTPFSLMGHPYWGVAAVGLVGLLGFIFHKQLLGLVVKRFQREKYAIAAGFRQA